jgi:hypothetical protein
VVATVGAGATSYLDVDGDLDGAPVVADGRWHAYDTKNAQGGLVVCKPIVREDQPPRSAVGCMSQAWTVRRTAAIFTGHFQDDWDFDDCKNCKGAGGRCSDSSLGSIHYAFGLGESAFGRRAAQISLDAVLPRPGLCHPSNLSINVGEGDEIIYNVDKVPVQVVNFSTVANLAVTGPDKFEVREFPRAAAGARKADGVYLLSGSPTRVVTFENPDPLDFNLLLITVASGGRITESHQFRYTPATGVCLGIDQGRGTLPRGAHPFLESGAHRTPPALRWPGVGCARYRGGLSCLPLWRAVIPFCRVNPAMQERR